MRRLEPSVNGTFEILLLGWGLQSGSGSRKPASRGPCTVDATELLKRLRAGKGLGTYAPFVQCVLTPMAGREGARK